MSLDNFPLPFCYQFVLLPPFSVRSKKILCLNGVQICRLIFLFEGHLLDPVRVQGLLSFVVEGLTWIFSGLLVYLISSFSDLLTLV